MNRLPSDNYAVRRVALITVIILVVVGRLRSWLGGSAMKLSSRLFGLVALLFVCVGLVALTSCKPESARVSVSQAGESTSLVQTATPSISVLPTPTINPDDIEPTMPPSPTPPPVPTPLPTPVVTPIPIVIPPIISLSSDQTTKPYMLVFHNKDMIQAISSNVSTDSVLLDVHAQSPLFLADERSNIYSGGIHRQMGNDWHSC